MKKIMIINGANMNLLGLREKEFYGDFSYNELEKNLVLFAKERDIDLTFFQSNIEGEIINKIHEMVLSKDYDGLIINPGAYSHYSLAIYDALKILKLPKIEVHFSNINARENIRKEMLTAGVCDGVIVGLGINSYKLAINYFML